MENLCRRFPVLSEMVFSNLNDQSLANGKKAIPEIAEFLESPEAAAVAAPLALIAATPPPLPTFVPQGTPPPTAGGPAGGGGGGPGGTGGGGGGAGAAGGGILPGVALAVRTNLV